MHSDGMEVIMNYKYLGDPCRNFCILASIQIMDPRDGQEKIILSDFVSGGTGRLIFIDIQSGNGESVALPGDEGAWALLSINNEKLLVGTCGLKGYLHCLDLKSRTWAEPLRDGDETYIWNLVPGSDGMVYGGTYPGCVLFRYDPGKHTLENMGRMSPYENNQYSRNVFGNAPGRIFTNCGFDKPHTSMYDLSTCRVKTFGKEGASIKEVNKDFVCTVTDDEVDFYDPVTLEPISVTLSLSHLKSQRYHDNTPISEFINKYLNPEKDARIPREIGYVLAFDNGDKAGVRGQEYFYMRKEDTKLKLLPIPTEAPPTQILTITSAKDGKIWGSSNFGQTIFSFDPADGTWWNSAAVCNRGGEVYGIRVIDGKVFMAAYAGGDHVVYDPSMPWNQINNINPITIEQAGPDLIRPHGKSVVGPDGAFWTGWTAKYGVYGGGLSRIDPQSYDMKLWYDPIPGQGIESLAAGEKYLYFTTSGRGNGLKTKAGTFCLGVCDTEGKLVHKLEFPEGSEPGCVEIAGDYGSVCLNDELIIFNSVSFDFIRRIKLPCACTCLIKQNDERLLVFCENKLFTVVLLEGGLKLAAELPGPVKTATVTANGEIFFAINEHLYKLYAFTC